MIALPLPKRPQGIAQDVGYQHREVGPRRIEQRIDLKAVLRKRNGRHGE
jgi:hypothetical protein